MTAMALGDGVFVLLAAAAVPLLAVHYLGRCPNLRRHVPWVVAGAFVWLLYAVFHESLTEMAFGLEQADARSHREDGLRIAKAIERGEWSYVAYYARPGNDAHRLWLGFLYYVSGSKGTASVVLNMVLAFWGSLTLTRLLARQFWTRRVSVPLLVLLVFTPSVVFWATSNLKEAPMYWGICQVFGALEPGGRFVRAGRHGLIALGIVTGAIFRPHIMSIWLAGLVAVGLVQRGKRIWAGVAVAAFPVVFLLLEQLVGAQITVSEAREQLRQNYASISESASGSDIGYGSGGPLFFVSGFTALFLRPFLWEARGLAQLLAAAEIWVVSGLIVLLWLGAGRKARRHLLGQPAVRIALVVCVMFCVLYTWMGNEGLLVRQRVQALPALLALVAAPWLLRARTIAVPARGWHRWPPPASPRATAQLVNRSAVSGRSTGAGPRKPEILPYPEDPGAL